MQGLSKNRTVLTDRAIQKKNIGIYPNPAQDILNIESDITSALYYSIYDVSGRVYLTGQVADNRIDVSGLRKGVYVLSLTHQEGTVRKKIVVE